jgi:HSP20 family protein
MMQDRVNRMNRLSRESYSPEGPEEALTSTSFAPPVDIYEDEHNITLKLEVPGIDEKDIDVRIDNNTLTVHGERNVEKEEKRAAVASSGSTETSPVRLLCPVLWTRGK